MSQEKNFRNCKQRIKTASGRKINSTKWIERHINDPFINLCKQKGYRSRAAFKLLEIEEKFQILQSAKVIIDLGAAPGGWLQVIKEKTTSAKVIAIDLIEIKPIDGVTFYQRDFNTLPDDVEFINSVVKQVDTIFSDMAPNSCGESKLDHIRIITLIESVINFSVKVLAQGGNFIIKLLKGGEEQRIFIQLKKYFKIVKYFKPKASYSDSAEIYIVALQYLN